ncbi:MAG: diacylglycerol/polyprenol kinase family protein [Candidatus Peregrinibacteria bacterium]
MIHSLEIRRQILHFLYGPLLVILYQKGILTLPLLGTMVIIGAGASYMIKHQRLSPIAYVLRFFERDHHMKNFPGRGILFFTLGAFLCLFLFEKSIAYAGILILSTGDAVSNLVGRHFGRIKTRLNPDKFFEGTILGILTTLPIAYYFVPNALAAVSACCLAMVLEMPHIKLFDFEIDDNLIIPVAASFTLNLFV